MVVFIGGGNDDRGGGSGGEGVNDGCGCGGRGGGNDDNRNGGGCWVSKFGQSLYYVQHVFIQSAAFGLDAIGWLKRKRE